MQRWIKNGCQAEQEHGDADPHDSLEARQLRAQFAGGVFLRRAKFSLGTRLFTLDDRHRRTHDDGLQVRDHRAGIIGRHAGIFDPRACRDGVSFRPHGFLILSRWLCGIVTLGDSLLDALSRLAQCGGATPFERSHRATGEKQRRDQHGDHRRHFTWSHLLHFTVEDSRQFFRLFFRATDAQQVGRFTGIFYGHAPGIVWRPAGP